MLFFLLCGRARVQLRSRRTSPVRRPFARAGPGQAGPRSSGRRQAPSSSSGCRLRCQVSDASRARVAGRSSSSQPVQAPSAQGQPAIAVRRQPADQLPFAVFYFSCRLEQQDQVVVVSPSLLFAARPFAFRAVSGPGPGPGQQGQVREVRTRPGLAVRPIGRQGRCCRCCCCRLSSSSCCCCSR